MNKTVNKVTRAITERSGASRKAYLDKIQKAADSGLNRSALPCSNFAHGIAACGSKNKASLQDDDVFNIGIVTAYNDMLSAHQPYETYPAQIRRFAEENGAVAQVAGGVPAMCDGVTQGQDGMDLSLFSRDVIALSTGIALSHNMFNGIMCLGICDKIVPGLLIGALSYGHLPCIFVPAGPMPSGLPNKEKARVREAFAAGEVGRPELLAAESASYHSPGTCTFYGTANSNQMLMEFMGLQLPGGSFVNPGTPLRDALTVQAVRQLLASTRKENRILPLGYIIDEKAIVNAMIGLLATGGSTNHTLHLVAIARAAGIKILWEDFADLSHVVPQLAKVYPNGLADVNHFHEAGGLGFMISQLLEAGLLHDDVHTVMGEAMSRYSLRPILGEKGLQWKESEVKSGDRSIVREYADPFHPEGGLQVLQGNLGKAIVKVSAVDKQHHKITAPARIFDSQDAFAEAYKAGELDTDVVVVVRGQGPRANGMPELHKLTPNLGVLQNRGFKVALLTDGRMSGASGKILAAIHVTPEAADGGMIACICDGDMIAIDAEAGQLNNLAGMAERAPAAVDKAASAQGMGRELFSVFRHEVSSAEEGASILFREY